jgi:hypothetical protein
MLDALSIRIMKRTSECRINERVWKRHNAYGRRSVSRICWLPIVLQQKWSMYLLTWTRELSTYLRSFFHYSACTLCSLSPLFYYIRPSSILIFCHVVFLVLLPVYTFFPSFLFSGSFVQCAQLFLQFLSFRIPGRSIIIALNGDVQNILSRPWSVKISLTDGTSCWIHLVTLNIFYCSKRQKDRTQVKQLRQSSPRYTWLNYGFVDWVLFSIVGKMGRRSNGLSE